MSFLVLTKLQASRVLSAIDKLEGLPVRGRVIRNGIDTGLFVSGLVDSNGVEQPGPGWTTASLPAPIDDGTNAAIDLPTSLEKYLGRTVVVSGTSVTLPTASDLKDESALPATIKAIRQASLDASLSSVVDSAQVKAQ